MSAPGPRQVYHGLCFAFKSFCESDLGAVVEHASAKPCVSGLVRYTRIIELLIDNG